MIKKVVDITNMKPKEISSLGNQILEIMGELLPTELLRRYNTDEAELAEFLRRREEMVEDLMIVQSVWEYHFMADLQSKPGRKEAFDSVSMYFNDAYKRLLENAQLFNDLQRNRYEIAVSRSKQIVN